MARVLPTDSELEILHILWDKVTASVREINDILNRNREVGYTTTLKIMQIMAEKGLVSRDTSSKIHLYKANIAENDTKNKLISDFVDATFHGSSMNMVMQALGNSNATKEDLDELKLLIKNLEESNSI